MADNRNLAAPTWATTAGFGFLTFNSGLAIYRSWGDLFSVLFVLGSYATLILLFAYLRAYERAAPGSPARERARRAVWPLTTLLTVAFAWKVASVMPSAVAAAVVWALAVATTAGQGLVAFFGSYTTLLLLFRCLRDYERRAAALSSPAAREQARRAVWPLTTLLTLAMGVVNCDMALIGIHKGRSDQLGTATCVLVAYAALLGLIWLLLREVAAGHPRGVGACGGEATRK